MVAISEAAACLLAGCGGPSVPHGDPDPGGRIMRAISAVEVGLPPHVRVLHRQHNESHWDSCDGRPGTFGWDDVSVRILFGTDEVRRDVMATVDARLRGAGWTLTGKGRRSVRWVHPAPHGPAMALLDSTGSEVSGLHVWELYASAPAVGELPPLKQGC